MKPGDLLRLRHGHSYASVSALPRVTIDDANPEIALMHDSQTCVVVSKLTAYATHIELPMDICLVVLGSCAGWINASVLEVIK